MPLDINAVSTGHDGFAVTPNDGADLPAAGVRALLIGASGTLKVNTLEGGTSNPRTYPNVPVGLFPIAVTKVFSTGTSASGIIAIL